MKSGRLFTLLAITALAFGSCEKDNNGGGGGGSNPTTVVITVPTNNQVVLNGTNLVIDGTVTDNDIIANVSVQVRNKATGAVLYSTQTTTPNVTFFRYTYNWNVTGVTSAFTATVKITGRDVSGGEGFKEVDINLEP